MSLSGERMWAVIAALVVYHETQCADGQLLSEAVDRAMEKHPVYRALVYGFTGITVGHLLNWLPAKADPYAGLGRIITKLKGNNE